VKLTGVNLAAGPTVEHGGTVEGIAVTADGQRLATAAFNDGFTLFDAKDGTRLHRWEEKGPHTLVAISPRDKLLAGGTITGEVAVYDLTTNEVKASWRTGRGNLFGLAFSPDGQVLAISNADASVALFNVESGKHLSDLRGNHGRARCVQFAPEGDVLVFGGDDGTVRFWDWRTGKEQRPLAAHPTIVMSLALSKDGRHLATGGADRTVRLWDLEQRRELFARPCDFPNSVALSPDGRIVACGNNRGFVKLWSVADGTLLREVLAHPGGTQCVRFSPDSQRLFSCGSNRRLALWDVRQIVEVLDR
jgi:WD40 repeat protein